MTTPAAPPPASQPNIPTPTFTLLGGALRLTNIPDSPRPAEDPLWLAALIPAHVSATLAHQPASILDVGCGGGVLGLSAGIFHPALRQCPLHLLDISPAQCALAARNASHNGLQPGHNVHTHVADITAPTLTANTQQTFQLILSNPPFHQTRQGHRSTSPRITQAHSAPPGLLERWLTGCLHLLAPQGHLHLITHSASIPLLRPLLTQHRVIEIPLATHATRAPKRTALHIQHAQTLNQASVRPFWQAQPAVPAWQPALRQQVQQQAQPLRWSPRGTPQVTS